MEHFKNKNFKRIIPYFVFASLLGFFFLAWIGLLLAPLSLLLIDKALIKFGNKIV